MCACLSAFLSDSITAILEWLLGSCKLNNISKNSLFWELLHHWNFNNFPTTSPPAPHCWLSELSKRPIALSLYHCELVRAFTMVRATSSSSLCGSRLETRLTTSVLIRATLGAASGSQSSNGCYKHKSSSQLYIPQCRPCAGDKVLQLNKYHFSPCSRSKY